MIYKRDYEREKKMARKRGDTGGSDSGNARRKRARRLWEREKGPVPKGYELHHKVPIAKGGSDRLRNLKPIPAKRNRRDGGVIGDKKGKAIGGKKAGLLRKRITTKKMQVRRIIKRGK